MFRKVLKKKTQFFTLKATQNGRIVPLKDVPDDAFSQKMLGDGVAIMPSDGQVVSPADGVVTKISDNKDLFQIHTKDGLNIFVHIGIDTFILRGKGFHSLIQEGAEVSVGSPLADIDCNAVRALGLELYTPIIIENTCKAKVIGYGSGPVTAGKSEVLVYTLEH